MRFDYMIIGFLLFGVMITGGIMMMNGYNNAYDDVNITGDEFAGVQEAIDDMTGVVNDLATETSDKTFNADITKDEEGAGSISSMTRGAYSAVRLVPRMFTLFHSILTDIANELGISCGSEDTSGACLFTNYAFLSFIVSVIFATVYLIFRFIPR